MKRVLIIAGSDSGGGAGIQGDIKTVTCLGGFATTAITAITAQNTKGVFGVHNVPPAFVAQQIKLVLEDIGTDSIKTGMLSNAAIIAAVADAIAPYTQKTPLVVDPVMVAKGGAPLLEPDAIDALKTLLFPRAALITPNIPEAELITGQKISSIQDMEMVGKKILAMGTNAVLIKGGHAEFGEQITNVLVTKNGVHHFTMPRIHTPHTHGTGCTLASAIATYLAQGNEISDSVEKAQHYVAKGIEHAPGFGSGHGPLMHNWNIMG